MIYIDSLTWSAALAVTWIINLSIWKEDLDDASSILLYPRLTFRIPTLQPSEIKCRSAAKNIINSTLAHMTNQTPFACQKKKLLTRKSLHLTKKVLQLQWEWLAFLCWSFYGMHTERGSPVTCCWTALLITHSILVTSREKISSEIQWAKISRERVSRKNGVFTITTEFLYFVLTWPLQNSYHHLSHLNHSSHRPRWKMLSVAAQPCFETFTCLKLYIRKGSGEHQSITWSHTIINLAKTLW